MHEDVSLGPRDLQDLRLTLSGLDPKDPKALGYRPAAAVLCPIFEKDGQAMVVLTRRSQRLRTHTGQVAFPGGKLEPGETPVDAALREASEEVGIDPAAVEVIGALSPVHTFSNPAPILPIVGVLARPPRLVPNPAEVERAFSVSLGQLMSPRVYHQELWEAKDGSGQEMHFFELDGDTVWGATARMLFELLCRLASKQVRAVRTEGP
jgi:8-oxo-dGTP pyrophosphatase MutT (NUDIX family)